MSTKLENIQLYFFKNKHSRSIVKMKNSILGFERPPFQINEISVLLEEYYGLFCKIEELPGERDLNFLIRKKSGDSFVLKISNSCETIDFMNVQNEAIELVSKKINTAKFPEIFLNKYGKTLTFVKSSLGTSHMMRIVRYVEGVPIAEYSPHTKKFLKSLGKMCGTVTNALKEISIAPFKRNLLWEIHNVKNILEEYIVFINDQELKKCVIQSLENFSNLLFSLEKKLRRGWIHNDFNDYNILVSPNLSESYNFGLIDFGDMTHSYLVADPAVACAYLMLEKKDPLDAAFNFIEGFNSNLKLEESEIEILFPMIIMRLCLSVTIGAFQQQKDPENKYLGISQKPARELLIELQEVNFRYAYYLFRDACKMEACPSGSKFKRWLQKSRDSFNSILGKKIDNEKTVILDLSVGSSFSARTENMSIKEQMKYFSEYLIEKKAETGLGKYGETRSFYTSKEFLHNSIDGNERRTIHLGIDIFSDTGKLVYSPIEGEVFCLKDNKRELDYGPTVILKHNPSEGPEFYTLYGHLDKGCLKNLKLHQVIEAGETFAKIGHPKENGGWLPHIHFQVILDIFNFIGNFPGVALPSQQSFWKSICPDPSIILGINSKKVKEKINKENLLIRRKKIFSSSLSLSYNDPLTILRGKGQSLIDSKGQVYLDCINNVAHIGHSHPRIVRAQTDQAYILNTNTRFLNPVNIDYAERLCDLFHESLDTCFLVCSGSEANELALRIALTVTGEKDVIVLEEGYHGNTLANIDISPYKHNGPGGYGPPDWVHKAPMPYLYRGKYQDPISAGNLYADEVKKICDNLVLNGRSPAAFICESMLGCGGHVPLPDNFLKQAYSFVRQNGGLCIADEVQVGFGRVGSHYWAFELQDVVPDIVTLGKPIGNGHPLGAVITRREIAEAFANGMEYFNTFGGSQVSCSVGMAVIDVIENEKLIQNASKTGNWLKNKLEGLKNSFPLIGDVRGEGFFLGIELVLDRQTKEPAPIHASYLVERMKSRKILLSTEGPGHNVIKFKPPMVFSQNDAKNLLIELENILSEYPLKNFNI